MKFDQVTKALVQEGIHQGLTPLMRVVEKRGSNPPRCPTCGDLRAIHIEMCKGPYTEVPRTSSVITFSEGGWWIVDNTVSRPCPTCGDRDAFYRALWEASGLEPSEREWRVAFLSGKDGKGDGLRSGLNILEQAPCPTGLHLYYGSYGVGKTGLLKALTAQLILAGVSARYMRAADLLSKIKATYDDQATLTESILFAELTSLRFLALDEVDVVNETAWTETTLRTILDTRYARRDAVATLIATNLHPDKLWPYLASRMEDGERVLLAGSSLRGAKPDWVGRKDFE